MIWASDVGDRYWALVRSGIQKEALTPAEEHKKNSVGSSAQYRGWGWIWTSRCFERLPDCDGAV